MSYKAIAGIIPTMQSVALVSHNLKTVKKKKTSAKDMVGLGVTNVVGVSMIKINADLIAGM